MGERGSEVKKIDAFHQPQNFSPIPRINETMGSQLPTRRTSFRCTYPNGRIPAGGRNWGAFIRNCRRRFPHSKRYIIPSPTQWRKPPQILQFTLNRTFSSEERSGPNSAKALEAPLIRNITYPPHEAACETYHITPRNNSKKRTHVIPYGDTVTTKNISN